MLGDLEQIAVLEEELEVVERLNGVLALVELLVALELCDQFAAT